MSLSMLLLVLMVCITLGIASRAREKAELQTMADAAAYSNAIATARTYNTASLLNRVMVSHYAAMTTVQAHVAWVTSVQSVFGNAAGLAREMEIPYPPGLNDPTCSNPRSDPPRWYECPMYWRTENVTSCRSDSIRPVSYELWHAGLSMYHPSPQYAGDSVNGLCTAGAPTAAADCSAKRNYLGPKGMPELDKEVADQVKDIHEAIYDLARIQYRTWQKLRNATNTGALTKQIIKRAQGGATGAGTLKSENDAEQVAVQELDLATDVNQEHYAPYADTMGQAVMGARVSGLALEHDHDVFTKRLMDLYKQTKGNLKTLGWDFQMAGTFGKPDVRGLVSPTVSLGDTKDMENKGLDPTMRVAYGDMQIRISLGWTPTCGPDSGVPRFVIQDLRIIVGAAKGQAWHYLHDGGGHTGPSGNSVASGGGWNACHIGHAHYGENDESIHFLKHDLLPENSLGLVFPASGAKGKLVGANGIWGQPKLPVVLSRSGGKADPWELDLNFRFGKTGAGTDLDLKDGSNSNMPKMAAYAAGVAYYHRRNHLGEPPNMLNPYWRATLVPAEIDEHPTGEGDLSPGKRSPPGTARDTGDAKGPLQYDAISRNAYSKLRPLLKPLEAP